MSKFRIGILGGKGRMGKFFANFFQKKGYEVLIKDRDFGPSYEEFCGQAKVILLSVPIEVFPRVVEEISSHLSSSHWVFDVCSLKLGPVKLMRRYFKKGEVLATHPLFGPFEPTLAGKKIAYYPLRGKGLLQWLQDVFASEGVKFVYIPPKEHDRLMALIQVMNHFFLILFGILLKDSKFELEKVCDLATPSFVRQLQILKRLAWQDENLYARIQLDNPYAKYFRRLFLRKCRELVKLFADRRIAEEVFKENFLKAKEVATELLRLLPEEG